MSFNFYTQVPNEILDHHLPYLSVSQLKVLLVIVRQTLGWKNKKTGKPKRKDWISISFFAKRTGLTYRSISIAIAELVERELIIVLDRSERELRTAKERRGKRRLYYAYGPYFRTLRKRTIVNTLANLYKNPLKTTETQTKETYNKPSNQ